MLRRMLLMLGAVIVVVLILAAFKFNSIYSQSSNSRHRSRRSMLRLPSRAACPGKAGFRRLER